MNIFLIFKVYVVVGQIMDNFIYFNQYILDTKFM